MRDSFDLVWNVVDKTSNTDIVALGEYRHRFEWADRAYEERYPFLCYLKVDPFFSVLHSNPRYIDMLKKISLDR